VTFRHPALLKLLAAPLAFIAVLLALHAAGGPSPTRSFGGSSSASVPPARTTSARIGALQQSIRDGAGSSGAYAALGGAYLQRVRETGDAGDYQRAQGAFAAALRRDPRSPEALAGAGSLALALHDFRRGLRYGLAAQRAAPQSVAPLYVIVDAQVELGRYAAAAATLQKAIDRKPTLAGYARASYVRELRGDLGGAIEAMRLAVTSGGPAAENVAYVQVLLGNLELQRGRVAAARAAYREALARLPGYVPATAGLGRVDAVRGDLGGAIRRYRDAVTRLPLPEYVVALGEAELAAGRKGPARRDLALVRAQQRLLGASGVNTDVDLALFEAEHGSTTRGVALARRAWAAAPSVRSADALGYALGRAGRAGEGVSWMRRALRLGWRDPLVLFHAGMTARAAGKPALARRWLSAALERTPRFNPLLAPRAKRALEEVR